MKTYFYLLIVCVFSSLNSLSALSPADISITLGERKTLLSSGGLGLDYFPDEAAVVLSKKPVYRILITAAKATFLVEGSDIEHLTNSREVLRPGKPGTFDNGYAGISGAYQYSNNCWIAVYHAEDQEGMPPIGGGIPGFYARIGLALSTNNGETWEKAGPVITSSKPKEWTYYSGQADRGAAEPGLVLETNGVYLYAYYTELSRQDGRGEQVCLARACITKGIPMPGSWKKYYNGSFSQPGIGGLDTPVLSAMKHDKAEAIFPHVFYSKYIGKYVMTLNINYWKEYYYNTGLKNSGIYISYSDNGIEWSEPEMLIRDYAVAMPGKSLSWQSAIIFDSDEGREGWLVYGYTPRWGHKYNNSGTPHYMAGSRISFGIKNQ